MAQALPTLCIVGKVVSLLSKTGANGTVLMSFERSAYLQFNQQLLCFGLRELGASPITGLFDQSVSVLPHTFVRGTTAKLSTHGLLMDNKHLFELPNACLYVSSLPEHVQKFGAPYLQYELLGELKIPTSGLAPFLQYLSKASSVAGSTGIAVTAVSDSALINFVRPAIEQLTSQLRANCASAVDDAADGETSVFAPASYRQLLGAGPGLTPSGDDFLCGVFTALHLLGFADVARSLWASIQTIAVKSTTQISCALMEQSAAGESNEWLDALVNAYGSYPGTSSKEFQQLVEQIGGTSGWDWLTGYVWCLHCAKQHVDHSQIRNIC